MTVNHELPGWAESVGGALATAVVGFLLWLLKRGIGAPAAQAEINEGFVDLLAETRVALNETRKELSETRVQRTELRELLAAEKTERAAERQQYRGEINQLRAIVDGLERLLRRNGIEIPPRKAIPELPTTVGVTLRQDEFDEG